MNVDEILMEIQDRTDEPQIGLDSAVRWINQCQNMLAFDFGPETISDAAINTDYTEYRWDPAFIDVIKVVYLDDNYNYIRTLSPINYRDIRNNKGTPYHYFLRGRNTGIYPYPDNSVSGFIRMYGKQRFSNVINEDDIPEIHSNYHDIFVIYGCMRFYEKYMDDLNQIGYYKNELALRINDLKKETQRKNGPRTVKVGAWY